MVKVTVKWGSQTFPDVVLDTAEPVSVFRAQLWTLTGVPPERQKIMGVKGGLLKDGADLAALGLQEGAKLMLVGTAEGNEVKAPTEKTIFIEDLTPEQRMALLKEKKLDPLPLGLVNLGVTCYLNSIIQFTKPVAAFQEAVRKLPGTFSSSDIDLKLCAAFRELYKEMDIATEPVVPAAVVGIMREKFPQFAQQSRSGPGYMQQDAEECLSLKLGVLGRHMPGKDVKSFFGFDLQTRLTCKDGGGEDEVRTDSAIILSCHLGSQLAPVDHMFQGIKLSLEEKIVKNNPSLGRDAEYLKKSRIATLPEYLIVHFVRFEWKRASNSARTEAGRAKICRKINFSANFDVFEFCTEELQRSLSKGGRAVRARRAEIEAGARNVIKPKVSESEKKTEDAKEGSPKPDEGEAKEENEDLKMEEKPKATGTPLPTGEYELVSIVTHQGRSADSGHYIGWTRKETNTDTWYKFDDDKVTEWKWKDLDLAGGRSDHHIAILVMYKKKMIVPEEGELEALTEKSSTQPSKSEEASASSSSA